MAARVTNRPGAFLLAIGLCNLIASMGSTTVTSAIDVSQSPGDKPSQLTVQERQREVAYAREKLLRSIGERQMSESKPRVQSPPPAKGEKPPKQRIPCNSPELQNDDCKECLDNGCWHCRSAADGAQKCFEFDDKGQVPADATSFCAPLDTVSLGQDCDKCSMMKSCRSCAAYSWCAWCSNTDSCLLSPIDPDSCKASGGSEEDPNLGVVNFASDCREPCPKYTTCEECVLEKACQWIGSKWDLTPVEKCGYKTTPMGGVRLANSIIGCKDPLIHADTSPTKEDDYPEQ